MVHILSRYYENIYSNRKESMELISKFSNTDFKNYFALLDKPSFDKYKNFGNALKLYYKYNFEDCDDNVKYEYGKALCLVNNYPIIAPNLGEKIIKELYDGYGFEEDWNLEHRSRSDYPYGRFQCQTRESGSEGS